MKWLVCGLLMQFVAVSSPEVEEKPFTFVVRNAEGELVPGAQVMLESGSAISEWTGVNNDVVSILLEDRAPNEETTWTARAPRYAPATGKIPAPRGTNVVTLSRGREVTIRIDPWDERPPPDLLVPIFYTDDFEDIAEYETYDIQSPQFTNEVQKYPMGCVSVPTRVDSFTYSASIDSNATRFNVLISAPGYLRSIHRSGIPVSETPLTIPLPRPNSLTVTFRSVEDGSTPDLGDFSLFLYSVGRPEKSLDGVEATRAGLGIPWTYQESLMDGTYTLSITCNRRSPPGTFAWDPIYRYEQVVTLEGGETQEVDIVYQPFDTNSLRGDCSAVVTVRDVEGAPAADQPYSVSFYHTNHMNIAVREGTLDTNGSVTVAGLAALGEGESYAFSVNDVHRGSIEFAATNATKEFTFTLPPGVGNKAPAITTYSVDTGEAVDWGPFAGKVVYLDFWATWCGPCQEPLQHLEEMVEEKGAAWEDKVACVAISVDDSLEKVRKHLKRKQWGRAHHQWNGPDSEQGPTAAGLVYAVRGIPYGVLIDREGVIRWMGHPSELDLAEKIAAILAGE